MGKNVLLLTGAGQIGMAIARRMGYGMKIIIGDKKPENAQSVSKTMNEAGFDTVAMEMDLSNRSSIQAFIARENNMGLLPCWSMQPVFHRAKHLWKLF